MKIKELIKTHQQKIVLSVGYLLVAVLAFGVGRLTAYKYSAPEIKIEQAFLPPDNYSPNIAGAQLQETQQAEGDCKGKIKGNVSSSGMIYHVPGGSFYDRTNAEMCFDTEEQARAAGFRKSSR